MRILLSVLIYGTYVYIVYCEYKNLTCGNILVHLETIK